MKYRRLFLSFTLLLFAIGCNGKVPLTGTVTFSEDGAPLTKGAVFFQSATVLAQGPLKPDGTFQVGTDEADDGLPRGSYQVFLVGTEEIKVAASAIRGTTGPGTREIRTPVIDEKYATAETSGLSIVVDGKTKVYDIKVERAKK